MAQTPQAYPVPPSIATANYDWTDIADGTGFVRLYGARTNPTAGEDWVLISNTDFSDSEYKTGWDGIDESWTENTDAYSKRLDLDFDLSAFNTQRTIRGTAHVQHGFYWNVVTGTLNVYMVYKLIRVRSGTPTTIGTGTSHTYVISTNDEYGVISIPISLTTTNIKKGDILRLTVEGWSKMTTTGSGENGICTVGVDPKDRDGAVITPSSQNNTTQLVLDVPFDIIQV